MRSVPTPSRPARPPATRHRGATRHRRGVSRRAAIATLALALLALAGPGATVAHRPVEAAADVTQIPDLETSYAFYRDLGAGEIQRYAIDGGVGRRLDVGVSIPALERYATYEVGLALVGPGLPRDGALPAAIAAEVDGDEGWIAAPPADSGPFFEPFTQTDYRQGQRIVLDLPADGAYELLVWQPAGTAGKYVLDSGRAEVFGPADLLRFPGWWVSVNAYFGHWWRIGLAGLIVALLAVAAVRPIVRRVAEGRPQRAASVPRGTGTQLRSR